MLCLLVVTYPENTMQDVYLIAVIFLLCIIVLTVLLYGCESWTLYCGHVKLLDQFHQRCLWCILNIKWYNRASNTKVFLQAQTPIINAPLTVSASMVWTSGAHAGQQATKATLLLWADRGSSTKGMAKALLQRLPEKIRTDMWHWWKTMGNRDHKQVWMEECYSQGTRSLWKWKTKQSTGKACSNEGQSHHCRAFCLISSMQPPVCIRFLSEIPHDGTQMNKVLAGQYQSR